MMILCLLTQLKITIMLKILKAVFSVLYSDPVILSIVGNKIFPDVVPDKDSSGKNIDYPLIVMHRSSLEPLETKGCNNCKQDIVSIELTCYATQYFQAVDLAQAVRDALICITGEVESINISKVMLVGADEGYTESVYYQQLMFNIK